MALSIPDPIWPRLKLWIDANHNGISEPNELFTLEQLDVCSISLAYKLDKKKDEWGNKFTYRASIGSCKTGAFDRTTYDVTSVG